MVTSCLHLVLLSVPSVKKKAHFLKLSSCLLLCDFSHKSFKVPYFILDLADVLGDFPGKFSLPGGCRFGYVSASAVLAVSIMFRAWLRLAPPIRESVYINRCNHVSNDGKQEVMKIHEECFPQNHKLNRT